MSSLGKRSVETDELKNDNELNPPRKKRRQNGNNDNNHGDNDNDNDNNQHIISINSNESTKKSNKNKDQKNEKNNKIDSKPPSKGDRLDKLPSYYFNVNGLRYIAPYDFEYRCFAKGRWFNREILDVMIKEFIAYNKEYYTNAILTGKITVCDKKVGLNYIIKNGDWITHSIHRHEPPVIGNEIKIIHDLNDFIIISKPASIPVHPCGKYRYNSLVYILCNETCQNEDFLATAHRIDRVTSGLMILCRNKEIASIMGQKIRERTMTKIYLARVKGDFSLLNNESRNDKNDTNNENDNIVISECKDEKKELCKDNDDNNNNNNIKFEKLNNGYIRVNEGIKCKDHRKGIHEIDNKKGKEAITDFQCLEYNGISSLVECRPLTGRTHQIRLHLQYLGYPIVNDFNYGGKILKSQKMDTMKDDKDNTLLKVLKKHWNDNCDECKLLMKELLYANKYNINNESKNDEILNENSNSNSNETNNENDNINDNINDNDSFEHSKPRTSLVCEIWLHAWRYECKEWSYQVPKPYWAQKGFKYNYINNEK